MALHSAPPLQTGLVASLFGHSTEETNAAMLGIYEGYQERWRSHLSSFLEGETDALRGLGESERFYARRRLEAPGKTVYATATAAPDTASASQWQVKADFTRNDPLVLSGMWWSIDPTQRADELLDNFLGAARTGPFLHGSAGFAITRPIGRIAWQLAWAAHFSWLCRYNGLDTVDLMGTRLRGTDGIKSLNWLTLLDNTLCDRLGGVRQLASSFSENVVVHTLDHGVVIQAGARPVLGEVTKPDELHVYREVAETLKPVFSARMRHVEGLTDQRGVNHSVAWRERFFRGAKWPP